MQTNSFESSTEITQDQPVPEAQTEGHYRSSSSGCSCACSSDEISHPSLSAGEETQESSSPVQSRGLPAAGQQACFDDLSLARVDMLTASGDQGIRSTTGIDLHKRNLIGCAEVGDRTHQSDVLEDVADIPNKAECHSHESQQLGVVDLSSQANISSTSARFTTCSSGLDFGGGQTLEDKVLALRQDMRIVKEKIDLARMSFAERHQRTEALNKLLSLLRRQELLRTVQRLRLQVARQTFRLQIHSQSLQKLSSTCTPVEPYQKLARPNLKL